MSTAGERLRAFLEDRYLELGLGRRHGWVSDLSTRAHVKRGTMQSWWNHTYERQPDLDSLGQIAAVLKVSRAELVAAMDDQQLLEVGAARAMVRREVEAALQAAQAEGLLPTPPTPRREHSRETSPQE